jgi:hypothetical protein
MGLRKEYEGALFPILILETIGVFLTAFYTGDFYPAPET